MQNLQDNYTKKKKKKSIKTKTGMDRWRRQLEIDLLPNYVPSPKMQNLQDTKKCVSKQGKEWIAEESFI